MIVVVQDHDHAALDPVHVDQFLQMIPAIKRQARLAFRDLDPEGKEEAIADVVANAFVAFYRLAQLGKTDIAYPTPLAMYGVKQYREGRRTGTKSNCKDISSSYCQKKKRFGVGRLDRFDKQDQHWIEILLEDKRSGPAEIVQAKLDIGDWMVSLSRRRRKIAVTLATGESTKAAARKFRVSAGRISQVRKELKKAWEAFVGEKPATAVA